MLSSGQRVPSFTLKDQDGIDFVLDDALGKGPLVLFFYPKDDSPGCTAEGSHGTFGWRGERGGEPPEPLGVMRGSIP